MDINNMDFVQLLPAFMREDKADIGLSKAMDIITEQLARKAVTGSTWDQLDNMCEAEIDLLADELNITWYDRTASLSAKCQIIKDSDLVHSKMGTTWATERVIETYFESGHFVEWYDYDGEPYHFKIQTQNRDVLNNKPTTFLNILNVVKRKSTVLDGIEVQVNDESILKMGLADRTMVEQEGEADARRRKIGLYVGVSYRELRSDKDFNEVDTRKRKIGLYVGVSYRELRSDKDFNEVDTRKRKIGLYVGITNRTLRITEGGVEINETDTRATEVELYIGIEHRLLRITKGGVDNEVFVNG